MESEEKHSKLCFKLSYNLFESLNVIHSSTHSLTVLWNKYQIFVYNDFKFEETPKFLEPEFNVSKVLICNNYLLCLDDSGNVHNVSLKFKHAAQKRFKGSFQPREQNITGIECIGDYIYALKLVSNTYYICRYKNNIDFQLETQIALDNINITLKPSEPNQSIFYSSVITELEFEKIKQFFKIEGFYKQHLLFLISLDRLSLWAFLCSNKSNDESIHVFKLYNSPSKISNVDIMKLEQLNVLIALEIGTIIKIPITLTINADIVHLNIAINKLLVISDILIYSDGETLWKCEKTFTSNIYLKQLFVKNVKDFFSIGNIVICTTYTNLIYSCLIDDHGNYLESATEKYCPSDQVLTNSSCLDNIMREIEKSDEIVTKINEKTKYITTLALSNRHDVMDTLIDYIVRVYDKFEDIFKENITVSIMEDIKEYYDDNSLYFFIQIATSTLHNSYNELLSNLYGDLKVHITLKTKEKILKTLTLSFNDIKRINIVVPIKTSKNETFYKVYVDIKLVTQILGVFESKQYVWTTLHKKSIVLNSENFIICNRTNNYFQSFNDSCNAEDLINKMASNQYGHLFNFNRVSKKDPKLWSLYLKLPENFNNLLKNETIITKNLDTPKALAIAKQITEEFLQSKSEICFNIDNKIVKLEIVNDGFTKPILKTSSENLDIAVDIKKFMSKLIYNFREMNPEMEFVDLALYTTVENLEKSIKICIKRDSFDVEEFMKLFEKYQKTVRSFLIT